MHVLWERKTAHARERGRGIRSDKYLGREEDRQTDKCVMSASVCCACSIGEGDSARERVGGGGFGWTFKDRDRQTSRQTGRQTDV